VVADGSSIYWFSDDAILKTSADDGATTTLVSQVPNLAFVGLDEGFLVWTSGTDRRLHRASVSSFADVDLGVSVAGAEGDFGTTSPSAAHGYLVWRDAATGLGSFYSLPLAATGTPQRQLLAPVPTDIRLTALGDALFWSRDGALWKADLPDASSPSQVASIVGTPIALRGDDVYVASGDPGGVMVKAVPVRGGGAPRSLVDANPDTAIERWASTACRQPGKFGVTSPPVVAEDEAVYATMWADCMDDNARATSIFRAAGLNVTPLVSYGPTDGETIGAMAVQGSCVVWVTTDTAAQTAGDTRATASLRIMAR
jgi:hypothetical protein